MKLRGDLLFGGAMLALSIFAVVTALGWPLQTKRFPLIAAIPMLIFSVFEVGAELYWSIRNPGQKRERREVMDVSVDWSMPNSLVAKRALVFFGWLIGILVAVLLFGFLLTMPLFTFLYLRVQAKQGWTFSISLTALVLALGVGVFDQLLGVPWTRGIVEYPEEALRAVFRIP